MKHQNGLTLAAVVLLFSACSLASTIDPGGIIRSGDGYTNYAIIEPGLVLTFDGEPVTSFDPFHAGFCSTTEGTPECDFENQSGEVINSLSQIFSHPPSDFTGVNTLSCINEISPDNCNTGPGNALNFFGLGIPSTSEWSSLILLDSLNTDPDFNILYFGFTDNGLADIASTSFSVPEPASLGLMFSGLFALGLSWKRRARTKSR